MKHDREVPEVPGSRVTPPLSEAPTTELVGRLFEQSADLVKKEVTLAKTELMSDLRRELEVAEGFGVAALCGLCGLNLILVALALALALVMPGWGAALIVAAVVLGVGALAAKLGWNRRVTNPLERTRRSVKEDVRWTKERLA
jgi:phosphoserine phosphatase